MSCKKSKQREKKFNRNVDETAIKHISVNLNCGFSPKLNQTKDLTQKKRSSFPNVFPYIKASMFP